MSQQPFELLEAFKGDRRFYLRYSRYGEVFYAAGERVQGDLDPATSYDTPLVHPLQPTSDDDWEALTTGLQAVPILALEHWAALREQLFSDILSREPNQGIAVSFDRMDYYIFYDDAGNFRTRRLIDKPVDYRVSARVDLRQMFSSWQGPLDDYLQGAGIESEDLIFNTGDLEQGAVPFLYINRRSKVIVLLQLDELPRNYPGKVPGDHFLLAAWHFVESHSTRLVMRPFSSLQSLLSVTADTALTAGEQLLIPRSGKRDAPPLGNAPPMNLEHWEAHLDRELHRPASRGEIDFLVDGEAFYTHLKDRMASARDSIDLRTYIFDNDDVALEIADQLRRRSAEGVDVGVLLDGLGTLTAAGEHAESLPEDHRPPSSIKSYLEHKSDIDVRLTGNPWFTGDHIKTVVVDGEAAFLGGMNIGREYRYDWHDLMVELRGPVVDEISEDFDRAWTRAGFWGDFGTLFSWRPRRTSTANEGVPLRLLYTAPGKQEIFRLQRQAIANARSYIYIQNAYFTDDRLLSDLVEARHRGVDVRVIIPLETDRGFITRNLALAANTLLANGVRVYIYPGFSHAKAAIFDGWACLGSANFDRLSLKINRELNIATSDPQTVAELQAVLFDPDFRHSRELTEPLRARWTDHLIEMFGDYVF